MNTLLTELFKGIFIGIGFSFGISLFIILFIKMIFGSSTSKYDASSLLKPFELYRDRIQQSENYEEMEIVDTIISALKEDRIIEDVGKYEIKSDTNLILAENNDGDSSKIKFKTTYSIVKMKVVSEVNNLKNKKK